MENSSQPALDVIIVGGGPAGLSAALVLGRCRRKVLIFDAGSPRNSASRAMHGFLSRDGTDPREFLEVAREQLRTYPSVELRKAEVTAAERAPGRFTVKLSDGSAYTSRILLLATGLVDEVPKLKGIERFYGITVHHCPYCDGWEHRDEPLAILGHGCEGAELALELSCWSRKLALCTNGEPVSTIPEDCSIQLLRLGVQVIDKPIASLEGDGNRLAALRFADGTEHACSALFFAGNQQQRSDLVSQLGCKFKGDVCVEHDDTRAEGVPGLYVAGNTCRGLQLVIMAAAEGTLAAFNINQALIEEGLKELLNAPPVREESIGKTDASS